MEWEGRKGVEGDRDEGVRRSSRETNVKNGVLRRQGVLRSLFLKYRSPWNSLSP
jgi:hypothetical protein